MTGRSGGVGPDPHRDHVDTETIADLIENLLPAAEAHRAREHVRACPECQQTYDALVRLSADLAEEGRTDIPMPAEVAAHLDAVIVSESVLRASTVGVHSLAQIRDQPRRHMPRIMLAAAGVVALAAAGTAVVVSTADRSRDGAAGISPTAGPTAVETMTTSQVGPDVQRLLEASGAAVLRGNAAELSCARDFARGQPNSTLRLVQPASIDGERATVVGLQASSSRDVRVFVVTGCADSDAAHSRTGGRSGEPAVTYVTTITLRNR